jgi:hypothetical protein
MNQLLQAGTNEGSCYYGHSYKQNQFRARANIAQEARNLQEQARSGWKRLSVQTGAHHLQICHCYSIVCPCPVRQVTCTYKRT